MEKNLPVLSEGTKTAVGPDLQQAWADLVGAVCRNMLFSKLGSAGSGVTGLAYPGDREGDGRDRL